MPKKNNKLIYFNKLIAILLASNILTIFSTNNYAYQISLAYY